MRRLLAGLVAILSLSLVTAQLSEAAVTPGTKCSKAGATSTYNGKKYTCVKSGNKLVWNKGVTVAKPVPVTTPTPSPSATQTQAVAPTISSSPSIKNLDPMVTYSSDDGYIDDLNGACAFDPRTPSEWASITFPFQSKDKCAGFFRLGKYNLGTKRPQNEFDSPEKFKDTSHCKLTTPSTSRSGLGWTTADKGRNDWRELRKYPSPKTVIQLLPISALDTAPILNTPKEDYGKYLEFIKNWIEYSSDHGSNVEIRIPVKYIELKKNLGDYSIFHTNNHDNPEHVRLNKDVVAAADPIIDFSGVNIVFVVPTAGSKSTVLQQGALGPMNTSEGIIGVTSSQFAHQMTEPNLSPYSNLGAPFWWLHELFHAGFGLDDHYGDTNQNINTEYGMGWWSMMTPWGGDLTTYEKWLLGFINDSQVQCITKVTSSTHWIAPSTVRTTQSKSVMIPISGTRMLIVDSIRPAGLFYKIPQKNQGVLVYELDLMKDTHGMGMKLVLPTSRNIESNPFFLSGATLKIGESVISNGIRITVTESGTYGDVVKIEKA